MRFVCEDDGDGNPYDYLEMYRKDAAGPTDPKSVYLPSTGTDLADAPTNLAAFHAGFDFHGVANDIFIETHVERYEVSLILAPGFSRRRATGWRRTGLSSWMTNLPDPAATADQRKAYRYYIADECADGHWSIDEFGLGRRDAVRLLADLPNDDDGTTAYVNRYRPGKGTLFSKDLLNKPYKAQLAISRDYAGPPGRPAVFLGQRRGDLAGNRIRDLGPAARPARAFR